MFEEVSVVINGVRQHIKAVQRNATYGGQFFYALALATSYNYLIELTDERTQNHPEVQRVPSLRIILIDHLRAYALQHINLQRGTIFDDGLLGGPRSLREWQEAGYHTSRTASNYEKRARYWRAIYDGAPVTFQQPIATTGDIFTTQRTYQSSFISPKSKIPGRVQNKYSGLDVTYEDVIHSRDTRYAESIRLVPWWRALNYGTGGQGYPVSSALHFIEDAERSVPANIDKYMRLFEDFISEAFDDERLTTQNTQDTVETWAQQHIQVTKEYVAALDIARRLAFGVPF